MVLQLKQHKRYKYDAQATKKPKTETERGLEKEEANNEGVKTIEANNQEIIRGPLAVRDHFLASLWVFVNQVVYKNCL